MEIHLWQQNIWAQDNANPTNTPKAKVEAVASEGENEHKDLGYSCLCKTTQSQIKETLISFNDTIQKPQRNHKVTKYLKHLRKQRFIETGLLLSCLIRVNILVLYKKHVKFFHLKIQNLMRI